MGPYAVLIPIFLPILSGILLLCLQKKMRIGSMYCYTMIVLLGTAIFVIMNLQEQNAQITLFYLMDHIPIYFKIDGLGKVFSCVVTVIWLLAGIYGFSYMKKDVYKAQYFGFYLMVYGVLLGSHYAGNLITFYVFYELLTLLSTPLVLHLRTREAKMAALKYMFYSFCGAYLILYGLYFIYHYAPTIEFIGGNSLITSLIVGKESFLLVVVFLMILGFGVKAGMFPFHAWLWAAHPVAPGPASAVLSSVIVKTGVLGMIRVIYYVVGPKFLVGTWVQYAFLALSIFTIFIGSMLAYREDILKKRLAYSTISQVSYILFGLALFSPVGFVGSMLHVVSHALIKCTLFLVAGFMIHSTGKTRVSELTGIGKQMPITLFCFTIASLGLIGIPPTSGFMSKWYLAMGGLESSISFLPICGVVVLLISALLTAGYLLPITIKGFFPGESYVPDEHGHGEKDYLMLLPIIILTVLALLVGLLPNGITGYFIQIAEQIM